MHIAFLADNDPKHITTVRWDEAPVATVLRVILDWPYEGKPLYLVATTQDDQVWLKGFEALGMLKVLLYDTDWDVYLGAPKLIS